MNFLITSKSSFLREISMLNDDVEVLDNLTNSSTSKQSCKMSCDMRMCINVKAFCLSWPTSERFVWSLEISKEMCSNLGAIMLDDKIEVDDGEIAAIANENILRLPLAFSSKTLKL